MKSFLLSAFLLLFIISSLLHTQTTAPDSTMFRWIPKGSAGINVSQVSFNNWTQGGDNSITWSGTGNISLVYKTPGWRSENMLKIAYGRSKIGDDSYRTNENEIYLENIFSYGIGWAIDPFISNTVRSTISRGYDYKKDPAVQTADFFDPGYITQSLGFTYNKLTGFTTRMGLGFQEVVTNRFRQYSDDPDTKDKTEAFKFETGVESVTDGEVTLDDNVLFKSKLRLFTRFNHFDVWDVRWDNTITAQVNKYINVQFNVLTVYEKIQSPRTQLKEGLQLGLIYTLF
ncbi:MAG: DUF3078 domain-containing protein [Bacteroidota bacterium]